MAYLARDLDRRGDPRQVVPGAKSVLCVAMDYGPGGSAGSNAAGPVGRVSSYARGDDYHDLMGDRLSRLRRHSIQPLNKPNEAQSIDRLGR